MAQRNCCSRPHWRRRFPQSLLSLLALLAATHWVAAQGYAPQEAVKHMTLGQDLQAQLVASEPMVAQPVCIEFDDRGRLWVVQYIQYPNPSGLKRATVDRWSRTTYEQAPEPPPRGPKGADRISILEDTDGDGAADKAHDFLNGLNLATGLAFGHGGVFVLQVPYLLFYPDRNRDDVPDGDPIVCLNGFGMEDAHSVANSLTWGPDGWLYGCQGSTVTARIRGIEFQQGVWRYHPLTQEFELFCEGGGNSWGLDFDDEGELIYSTNLGPYRHLHGVQGAYYWKSFGKHGALHNPYAFGYFDHIPHTNFTGGHVTDGGIIYQGTNLPARFRGRYLCGDLLGHGVQWHEMYRWGSSFTSSHGGYLLEANDKWFAPTDVTMGPDGSVYVADWCDKRTAHPDPDADWDRSNGRIYRLSSKGTRQPVPALDVAKAPTSQLIAWLQAANPWLVRKACRVLADRRDPEAILPLRAQLLETKDDGMALKALWALYVSGGFTEKIGASLLQHRSAPVRKWSVRLLGDERKLSPPAAERLSELATAEPNVAVRAQLASTAQRLPAVQGLPIIWSLLLRDADRKDPFIPLLLWWAVERHAVSALTQVEDFFTSPKAWRSALVREVMVERLMRRWVAEGSSASYDACARLLASAPDTIQRDRLLAAMDQGFRDRPAGQVSFGTGGLFAKTAAAAAYNGSRSRPEQATEAFNAQIDALWQDNTEQPALIRVAARAGRPAALGRSRALVKDPKVRAELRLAMIELLGELGDSSDWQPLLDLAGKGPESYQFAALDALQSYDVPQVATELLQRYSQLSQGARVRVRQLLLSRKAWALALFQEVEAGRVPSADFNVEQLRLVALHEDKRLNEFVHKHWGSISRGTAEEKLAEMRRLNNDLNAGQGEPARGKAVFGKACSACHVLFGEGKLVGPELTHANRSDREFLLASIVDPSAAIRKEYLAYDVETKDGRMLSGVMVEQTGGGLTLATSTGERVILPQAQIADVRESALSLMPEDLFKTLTPQEVRDLFAHLQSNPTAVSKP